MEPFAVLENDKELRLIDRRKMLVMTGKGALALALVTTIPLDGCSQSLSSILSDIENWVPVGLQAFDGLLTVLEGAGVISIVVGNPIAALVGVITAGFNDLIADIKAYQAINPPPAGALAKIEAGLSLVVSNFQTFLASINVTDNNLVTLVTGIAEIILSTIAAFQGDLPTATTLVGKTANVAGRQLAIVPKKRTIRAFKKDYNAVAVATNYPNIKLHLSLFEHF